MKFEIYGPFELPKDTDKNSRDFIDLGKEAINKFWSEIEEEVQGLKDACGCYIFVVNNKPYYVGKAEKQTFKDECFTDNKEKHYRKASKTIKKGSPRLYFIAKKTEGRDRFAKPSKRGHRDIEFLENFFIALAVERNINLTNSKNTRFIRNIIVPGFLNTGKGQPKEAHQNLKNVFK